MVIASRYFAPDGEYLAAEEAMRINEVPVYGRVRDVSASDIRYAIADGRLGKPLKLDVINSREMHAYYETSLGWTRVRLFPSVPLYNGKHVMWATDPLYIDAPVVSALIRSADEVYIFPVTNPLKPYHDDKRRRLLDRATRRKLVHLLSPKRNWYKGGFSQVVLGPPPRDVGLLFRHGRSQLVLFFPQGVTAWVDGTFDGQYISGVLEEGPAQQMDQWVQRYAQSKLAAK